MGDIYIAARRLKVGSGYREPGEPVPEAASWTTLRELLNGGYLSIVSDDQGTFHPLQHGWHVNPHDVVIDRDKYLDLCARAGVDPDLGNIGVTATAVSTAASTAASSAISTGSTPTAMKLAVPDADLAPRPDGTGLRAPAGLTAQARGLTDDSGAGGIVTSSTNTPVQALDTSWEPGKNSIEQTLAYAEQHRNEVAAIVSKEVDGKQRKSLLAALQQLNVRPHQS
jgi:hypothetical protein